MQPGTTKIEKEKHYIPALTGLVYSTTEFSHKNWKSAEESIIFRFMNCKFESFHFSEGLHWRVVSFNFWMILIQLISSLIVVQELGDSQESQASTQLNVFPQWAGELAPGDSKSVNFSGKYRCFNDELTECFMIWGLTVPGQGNAACSFLSSARFNCCGICMFLIMLSNLYR